MIEHVLLEECYRLSIYPTDGPLIYKSQAFKDVVTQAIGAGGSSSPLLVSGEAGAGKGVLARFAHSHGKRREYPCIYWEETQNDAEKMIRKLTGSIDRSGTKEIYKEGVFGEADGGTIIIRPESRSHAQSQLRRDPPSPIGSLLMQLGRLQRPLQHSCSPTSRHVGLGGNDQHASAHRRDRQPLRIAFHDHPLPRAQSQVR